MDALNLLKSKGLKKTAQRIMLINILQKNGISLSENEIRTGMGTMYDRITFYRTVQKLIEMEIISRIAVDNSSVRYALNNREEVKSAQSSVLFFCKKCNTSFNIKESPVPDFQLPDGYFPQECEVLIKGICPSCARTG
ncbi:MAG: transcriptional repressor [Dysgonamonadaceae bacterium]|jgi:Fur family ferric uptake transcriptional regulator|nr:transcriptional repressor [Dysgonamonadaceae bacterium]